MPSRSVLFLLTRLFIVLPTSMGPQPSNSRCLTVSGKSVQYESGSMVVFGSELAMFVPAEAKNLLKAFAISVLSVVGFPSVIISVIL
jgi:hypothetical protein